MPLYNPISRLLDLVERAHSSLTGIGADDHHNQQHAITGTGDHTSAATSGKMLKADANGLPVDASNTDTDVADAVTKKHTQQHAITATADHTSTATAGTILKADANGLPVDAANNDLMNVLAKYDGPYWFNSHWIPADMLDSSISSGCTISWENRQIQIQTAPTNGASANVYKSIYAFGNHTWAKNRYFCVYVYFENYASQYIHLVSGGISNVGASANVRQHIGFRMVDDTLYGTVADGTTEPTPVSLKTLVAAGTYKLEVVFQVGVEARFYLDGVDKGALTTNLPGTTAYSQFVFNASIYTGEDVYKNMRIRDVRVLQEE